MITLTEKKLNKEQLVAVKHKKGPLLIIAGAGTGKTTVITERVKFLIQADLAKPSEILALTFTEKAAAEMQERIDVAMPYGYTQMWISTFHSFCDRVLRSEALQVGLTPNYKLNTEAESTQFIRKNLFAFDLEYFRPLGNPTKFIGGMLQHFSRLQDEDIVPDSYLKWVKLQKGRVDETDYAKWQELANAYKIYDDLKNKEGVMDFGDLIVKTLNLFRLRPNILKSYQAMFKFVLVDEFQDTNIAQNELVKLLAGSAKNITVVLDDDQSIYRFRGAAISNALYFRANFPDAKVVTLITNYRSSQKILDKAYSLIQFNNPDRLEVVEKIDKKLIAHTKSLEGEIGFIHKDRVENEADEVAKTVSQLTHPVKGGGANYDYKDIAILVRANNHSEPFIRALARRGIPYQFLGPGRLFKQPEIVDLVAYLKVLYDFTDSVSLYRLLALDHFDIDQTDLIRLSNFARRKNLSLFETLEKRGEIYLTEDANVKLTNILEIIKEHQQLINTESAGQLLYYFLEKSDLLPKLLNPDTPEAQKKATNISKFFDKLKTYEVEHEDAGVVAVVDWIDLATELGESPLANDFDWTGINAVNILTVHSSKGLEFDVVFLVNLVSQRFPTTERREQIPIPDGLIKEVLPEGDYHLQEERRLFYVGLTRAKTKVYLTAADYYGEGKREKRLSPFIFETLGDDAVGSEKPRVEGEQLGLLDYQRPEGSLPIADTLPSVHIDYLSYSQIETFRVCPLHYKLSYIVRLPTPPSASLSFGTSMHAAIKRFYERVGEGAKPTDKLMYDILNDCWVDDGYLSKSHEQKFYEKGKLYLAGFLKVGFDPAITPRLMEQKFTLPLPYKDGERPLKIGGVMDRVDVLPGDKLGIVDYKTGATIPTQKEVDANLQLTFYALAATTLREEPFNKNPEKLDLALYFFDHQEKLATKRTRKDLDLAIDEIYTIRKQIENSDFKCSHSPICDNCEYKMFCNVD